jgi:hypothetical protein
MNPKTLIATLGLLSCAVIIPACVPNLGPSTDYNEALAHRNPDQISFEDSVKVFYADYVNPYQDKEVLWIASYVEGPVELRIYDMQNDSLETIIRFEQQDSPLYPLAYHADESRVMKCVVFAGGRAKCAKTFPEIHPLEHPQWGTTFTVDDLR